MRGVDDLVALVVGRLARPTALVGQSMGGYASDDHWVVRDHPEDVADRIRRHIGA